jgi:multimeric flavodoxin WrbA
MKILMINGSPKARGNTGIALREMEHVFPDKVHSAGEGRVRAA